MKKSDIAMIVLIATVGVIAAFFGTKAILGDSVSQEVSVKTIEPIKTEIGTVNPDVFNAEAINPTVEVQVTPSNQ